MPCAGSRTASPADADARARVRVRVLLLLYRRRGSKDERDEELPVPWQREWWPVRALLYVRACAPARAQAVVRSEPERTAEDYDDDGKAEELAVWEQVSVLVSRAARGGRAS